MVRNVAFGTVDCVPNQIARNRNAEVIRPQLARGCQAFAVLIDPEPLADVVAEMQPCIVGVRQFNLNHPRKACWLISVLQ